MRLIGKSPSIGAFHVTFQLPRCHCAFGLRLTGAQ
jgi:hypothetical protein